VRMKILLCLLLITTRCLCCSGFAPHDSKVASFSKTLFRNNNSNNNNIVLSAKNSAKKNPKKKGPRGSGGRGKTKNDEGDDDDDAPEAQITVPEPTKFRRQIISLPRPDPYPPVRVCIVEVSDVEWWNNENNVNPFGGKLWPSGLAVAQFLGSMGSLENCDLLEIGCGNGLCSIVAAESGARVVASDISPTTLKLTKIGWIETQKERQKKKAKLDMEKKNRDDDEDSVDGDVDEDANENENENANDNENENESSEIKPGSLNTFILDIFTDRPLPMSNSENRTKIVTATAMMYDADVAQGLARRAVEACARGAWVIIGDDDTGEREGGRQLFTAELDRMEKEKGVQFSRVWKQSAVKYKPLQWSEKPVRLLHLNAPPDAKLDLP